MPLHLHRAERTDLLADGLGALLANPLPDPFATELVVVPGAGHFIMDDDPARVVREVLDFLAAPEGGRAGAA